MSSFLHHPTAGKTLVAAGVSSRSGRSIGGSLPQPDKVRIICRWQSQVRPWLAESLGYSRAYARANGTAARIGFEEGEALLSRFAIRECQRHVLLPKPGLLENRVVPHAVLETPLGAQEVYNTHLSYRVKRDALRLEQVPEALPCATAPAS